MTFTLRSRDEIFDHSVDFDTGTGTQKQINPEASLIDSDFKFSVYGSPCNFLFILVSISFHFFLYLPVGISWHPVLPFRCHSNEAEYVLITVHELPDAN